MRETLSFDIADGQIQSIRSIVNPDKLRHLGAVSNVLRSRSGLGPGRSDPTSRTIVETG